MDVKQRLCYLDMANSSASIMDGYDGFLRREVVSFMVRRWCARIERTYVHSGVAQKFHHKAGRGPLQLD